MQAGTQARRRAGTRTFAYAHYIALDALERVFAINGNFQNRLLLSFHESRLASMVETWPSWPSPGHGDLAMLEAKAMKLKPLQRGGSFWDNPILWNLFLGRVWSIAGDEIEVWVCSRLCPLYRDLLFVHPYWPTSAKDHAGHLQESYWVITKVGMSKTAQEAELEPCAVLLRRQANSIASIQLHQFAFVF